MLIVSKFKKKNNTGQQTFSAKSQIVNILSFADPRIPVTRTHLCYCSTEAAVGNMEMTGLGCVPIKLDLRTLKFEFHTIFVSQNIIQFFSTTYKC